MKKLLVATNNHGKLTELRALLWGLPVKLNCLSGLDISDEVEETGSTFAENASLKAAGYAVQAGLPSIADDSGLEVTALDGRPGIFSARYGGVETSFDEKMHMLLDEIDRTGNEDRSARFVCSISIADAAGNILHTAEGMCSGSIAAEPSGNGGFGYDPVFIPDGYDLTFGELLPDIKRQISHRSRAFEAIMPFLRDFIAH